MGGHNTKYKSILKLAKDLISVKKCKRSNQCCLNLKVKRLRPLINLSVIWCILVLLVLDH